MSVAPSRMRKFEREALQNGTVIDNFRDYKTTHSGYIINPDGTVVSVRESVYKTMKELAEDYRKGSD